MKQLFMGKLIKTYLYHSLNFNYFHLVYDHLVRMIKRPEIHVGHSLWFTFHVISTVGISDEKR